MQRKSHLKNDTKSLYVAAGPYTHLTSQQDHMTDPDPIFQSCQSKFSPMVLQSQVKDYETSKSNHNKNIWTLSCEHPIIS